MVQIPIFGHLVVSMRDDGVVAASHCVMLVMFGSLPRELQGISSGGFWMSSLPSAWILDLGHDNGRDLECQEVPSMAFVIDWGCER